MREIKFRGRHKDNGEWVYGYYFKTSGYEQYWIHLIDDTSGEVAVPVIPETVGQFCGLKDKNGKEAFHKDICRDEFGQIWTMEWMDIAAFVLLLDGCDIDDADCEQIFDASAIEQMEIIGDIHTNPELLERP